MRINGEWYPCDDDVVRPIIRGEVMNANGLWEPILFLVDTAADRTVFSAAILDVLNFQPTYPTEDIGGVGGLAKAVAINTRVRLTCDDDTKAVFRGTYAACTELEALDICVLGRDLIEIFAVIIDRRDKVVCLLGQNHRYIITAY